MFAFLRSKFRRKSEQELMNEYFSQATSIQHLEMLMRNWDRGERS